MGRQRRAVLVVLAAAGLTAAACSGPPTSGSGDSRVARPADAKWWNIRSFSFKRSSRRGLSGGSGSFSKTSSAAPAIRPSSSARASAVSSTIGPRDVLTR